MNSGNRTCEITGFSLGTHGPAVRLVGGDTTSPRYISPEVCSSLVNVISREQEGLRDLYNKGTFELGRLKGHWEILRRIFHAFRVYPRIARFLKENFRVEQGMFDLWQREMEQDKQRSRTAARSKGQNAVHLY